MEKLLLTHPDLDRSILPIVILDKAKSVFKIYGNMYDDDVEIDKYLIKVKQWLIDYQVNPNNNSDFHFGFHRITEYGLKCITELVTIISKIANSKIYWEYDIDDEDMEEIVSEISNSTGVEIISRKVGIEIISGKVSIPDSIFDSPYFVPNT